MGNVDCATPEERILILAPSGRDAEATVKILTAAGLRTAICPGMDDLCAQIQEGAGAAVVANEALTEPAVRSLKQILAGAPPWSDLPLIVLTGYKGAPAAVHCDVSSGALGNVTFVERPIRAQTVSTAVHAALRARRRQYQARDLLREQQQAVQRMDLLAKVASHLLLSDRPEGIVESVFRMIATPLRLEVYLFYLFDDQSRRLELRSHAGLQEGVSRERQWFELHGSFCETVARGRKCVIADELTLSDHPATAHIQALGVTAYACFPLVANDRLIGTLSFGVRQRDQFQQEKLAVLETICNQVAVAIERQRTEEALHELNQMLEKRVAERTAQLQESNEQMEAFSYSISHDLRAPLRAIRGFAQALAEDYAPALDETGREYLARMGEGAERLDRLIQDLLQYSRVGRNTLNSAPLDLEASVRQVLEQLEPEIRSSRARIQVEGPLPRVVGHAPTLEQVIINLLSNALKFVAPGVEPRIRIWGTENKDTARLWIGDNGIGIDPAHQQRIFGVFERLHTTEAYPGTGIGLAIVAKGATRMGGSTGLESAVGAGSRFWVELRRAPRN